MKFSCFNTDSSDGSKTIDTDTTLSEFQRHISSIMYDDIQSSINKIVTSSRGKIIQKMEDNLNNVELLIINNVISNITSKIEKQFESRIHTLEKYIESISQKMNDIKDIESLTNRFSSKIDLLFQSKINDLDSHVNLLTQTLKTSSSNDLERLSNTFISFSESSQEATQEVVQVVEAAQEATQEQVQELVQVVEAAQEQVEAAQEKVEAVQEQVQEQVEAVVEAVQEQVEEQVEEQVQEVVEVAQEQVQEQVEAVVEAVQEQVEAVQEQVQEQAEAAVEAVQEQVEAAQEVVQDTILEAAGVEVEKAIDSLAEAVTDSKIDSDIVIDTIQKAEEIIDTSIETPKSSLKALVAQYHKQITVGCGRTTCKSDCCASNRDITLPTSPTSIVRMAINLVKINAPLCKLVEESLLEKVLEEATDAIAETVVKTIMDAVLDAVKETIDHLDNNKNE